MKKLILLVIMCMLFSGTATASKLGAIKYIFKQSEKGGKFIRNPRARVSSPKAFRSRDKYEPKEESNIYNSIDLVKEVGGKLIDITKCRNDEREYHRQQQRQENRSKRRC